MWNGRFEREQFIFERYQQANTPHREKLRKLFAQDIDKLRTVRPQGRLMLETYDQTEKRFELK